MTPHLLQVCNVGQIVGGTAACAWTTARALPGFRHTIVCLSSITPETRAAFAHHRLESWDAITPERVRAVRPDVLLLHNTSPQRLLGRLPVPTVQYQHSETRVAPADLTLVCSHWLAERTKKPTADVCWQAVPRPLKHTAAIDRSAPREELVVGRICTPSARKWPESIVDQSRELARRFPRVRWEFVGCPQPLQAPLKAACGPRTVFWSAGWDRRALFWTWDALWYSQPELPESFGRVVAESMRAGCLPIVDRQGGFIEQLAEGGGWLCASTTDFVSAFDQLQDNTIRQTRSAEATRIADQNWSLASFARRLLARFDEVVS